MLYQPISKIQTTTDQIERRRSRNPLDSVNLVEFFLCSAIVLGFVLALAIYFGGKQ